MENQNFFTFFIILIGGSIFLYGEKNTQHRPLLPLKPIYSVNSTSSSLVREESDYMVKKSRPVKRESIIQRKDIQIHSMNSVTHAVHKSQKVSQLRTATIMLSKDHNNESFLKKEGRKLYLD